MKLSLSTFLLTVALAQANKEAQSHRQLDLSIAPTPSLPTTPVTFNGPGCVNYDPSDSGWDTRTFEDNQTFSDIGLGFGFLFGGVTRTTVAINANGRLLFDDGTTPRGDAIPAIEVFRGDALLANGGEIIWKQVSHSKFAVIWHEIAPIGYGQDSGLANTFEVVLSTDGSICLCYEEMQWASGTDPVEYLAYSDVGIISSSTSGFLLGSFSQLDDTWNGLGSSDNGLFHLNGHSYCLDENIVSSTLPECDIISTNDVTIDCSRASEASRRFDYAASTTGSQKCALINVIMDESGSMDYDQAFMRDTALPTMARELYSPEYGYEEVFICSTGFTAYSKFGYGTTHTKFKGCTTMDSSGGYGSTRPTDWIQTEVMEDGWLAMNVGMSNVPASIDDMDLLSVCATIDKNLILVTDEDRDKVSGDTFGGVQQMVADNGYVLNVVTNVIIAEDRGKLGMKIAANGQDATIYEADPTATKGYITYERNGEPFEDYVVRGWVFAETTHADYTQLIVGTKGAVWSIQSLRDPSYAAAFAVAFTDVKVEEISAGTGGPSGGCGESCGGVRPETNSGTGGDPHFMTWNNEHYEYHGQCDLVLTKDAAFAEGLGLDIQIRTKVVRFWSYIHSVAIKIGDDILEIKGSSDKDDADAHYWINFEYQGELDNIGGFPVTQHEVGNLINKREYKIDLSSTTSIIFQLYKEFIRVKFSGDTSMLANTVGLLGDYQTGKLVARDGSTAMDDFSDFGDEWQVLPSEPKLFHEVAHPHFPERCIKPEDPRGARKRRLAESNISIEAAEVACGKALVDPLSIKDCVYDIMATQDMDMVGAF